MKSIEEKAKAYDWAIEKLRRLHDDYDTVSTLIDIKEELEHIFPELKESEDERIRKALINRIECFNEKHMLFNNGVSKNKVIAWLEKQGEHPTTIPEWKYKKDNAPLLRDSLILNKYGCVDKSPSGALVSDVWVIGYDELAKLPKEESEKQGEQKPDDKVEPKFKVGDWIVNNGDGDDVCRITNILTDLDSSDEFSYEHTEGWFHNSFEDSFLLWTIQDAKAGDILADDRAILLFRSIGNRNRKNVISYYAILETNLNNRFSISDDEEYWGKVENCELKPASKEQCELLFQKMKEAGYVWGAKKKELKKIEQKYTPIEQNVDNKKLQDIVIEEINKYGGNESYKAPWALDSTGVQYPFYFAKLGAKWQKEQKPAWSEEDKRIVTELIGIFESAIDGGHVTFPYRLVKDYIRVLKLCLPQSQWEPSDEQMENLSRAINGGTFRTSLLMELYQDLKKLREE